MSEQYEFNEQQNEVFSKLATSLRVVGIANMVLGPITMLGVLNEDYGSIITGAVYFVIGYLTFTASSPVQAIVETEGNDIDYLMVAMEKLEKLYSIQKVIIFMAVIIIVFALVFVLTLSGTT
mgnify:CR=1 FL=1